MWRPKRWIRAALWMAAVLVLLGIMLRYPAPGVPQVLVAVHVVLSVLALFAAIALVGGRRYFFAGWAIFATLWSWSFYETQGVVPIAWKPAANASSGGGFFFFGGKAEGHSDAMQDVFPPLARNVAAAMPSPQLRVGMTVRAPQVEIPMDAQDLSQIVTAEAARELEEHPNERGYLQTTITAQEGQYFQVSGAPHRYEPGALEYVFDVQTIERTLKSYLGILFSAFGGGLLWALFGRRAGCKESAEASRHETANDESVAKFSSPRRRFTIRSLLGLAACVAVAAAILRYPRPWLPPVLVVAHVLLSVFAACAACRSEGSRRIFFAGWAVCASLWTASFYESQGVVPVAWNFPESIRERMWRQDRFPPRPPLLDKATEQLAKILPRPRLEVGLIVLAPAVDMNAPERLVESVDVRQADAQASATETLAGLDGSGWIGSRIVSQEDGRYRIWESPHLYESEALRGVPDVTTIKRTLQSTLGFLFTWIGAGVLWGIFGRMANASAASGKVVACD